MKTIGIEISAFVVFIVTLLVILVYFEWRMKGVALNE